MELWPGWQGVDTVLVPAFCTVCTPSTPHSNSMSSIITILISSSGPLSSSKLSFHYHQFFNFTAFVRVNIFYTSTFWKWREFCYIFWSDVYFGPIIPLVRYKENNIAIPVKILYIYSGKNVFFPQLSWHILFWESSKSRQSASFQYLWKYTFTHQYMQYFYFSTLYTYLQRK